MVDPLAHLDFEPDCIRLLAPHDAVVVDFNCAGCGRLVTAGYVPGPNNLDPVAACACGVQRFLT